MRMQHAPDSTGTIPDPAPKPSALRVAILRAAHQMYLEEGAVMNTLRFIASLAPGSGVVFDYGVLPRLLSSVERARMEFFAARAAEHGEVWKAYFDPSSLVEALRSMGFGQVEDFGPERLNERYFSGRRDGLRKSGVSRLICARS